MGVLSRRYATALYEAAEQAGELDAVRQALDALGSALAEPEVREFLRAEHIERGSKRAALEAALAAAPTLVKNFSSLVLDRGREAILPEAVEDFRALDRKRRGQATGRLEVARDITPEELEAVRAKARAIFGVEVDFEVRRVPDLIGGFRLTVDHRRIDASVRHRLEGLKRTMYLASVD